uniref:DNA-directed RNA polymerase 40k chain subunit n=1 Tax=Lotharella vacuolata TaxID=74820 RepID=A0A0H5BGU8_9EUKA|nr:DNA-directed RNA polymerase 40k chain subunit [Lotharella vacuolata]
MIVFSMTHKNENIIVQTKHFYQTWDINNFIEGFQLKIINKTKFCIQLEIIGIDSAIINSLRRIIISESPSFAFENIYIFNNSSILNDNIIAQRLALIPIKADPRSMKFKKKNCFGNQFNTIVYILKTVNLSTDNHFCKRIYSKNLKISKHGSIIPFQSKTYYTNFQKNNIKISHLDLLIAKIKPKQKLFMELHAIKGYGYMHNKFSPITTAWFSYYSSIFFIKNLNYLKKNIFTYKKNLFIKKNINKTKTQKLSSLFFHDNYFTNLMKISNIFKVTQKNSNIKRKIILFITSKLLVL